MIIQFPPPSSIISTALNVLQFIGGTAEDQVAVFDDSYNQVFSSARIVKVGVSPASRLMEHPIEDGSIRTDFRILLPTELELSVICPGESFADIYQEIKEAYESGDVFTVTTKTDTYFNMMIQSIPHDEEPDMFDAVAVGIRMKEVLVVETQYQALPPDQVANKNDQSTVNTGSTAPNNAPTPVTTSIAKSLFNK